MSYLVGEGAALAKRQNVSPNVTPTNPNGLVLEAWAQGFMVGALIIMSCITLANMRRGVLLHKLILIEVSSDLCTERRSVSDLKCSLSLASGTAFS